MDLSRRTLIGGVLAAVPAGAAGLSPAADPARPPFHVTRESDDLWSFRSWRWNADAWRPLVGSIRAEGTALRVVGRADPRDANALQAALARIAADRSGWSAR